MSAQPVAGSRLPRFVVIGSYRDASQPFDVRRCATRQAADAYAAELRQEAERLGYPVTVQVFELSERDTLTLDCRE